MAEWIRNNPTWFAATVQALVAAVLNLVLAFGVDVTGEQTAAINGLVMVVVALGMGMWAQAPLAKLLERARRGQL